MKNFFATTVSKSEKTSQARSRLDPEYTKSVCKSAGPVIKKTKFRKCRQQGFEGPKLSMTQKKYRLEGDGLAHHGPHKSDTGGSR